MTNVGWKKRMAKKRKRDQFILKNETSPSHKKSKQYSSSNSSSGGSGSGGTGSGSSGSTGSTTNKKLTSVIDRLSSSSHNDSGIEIIPRNDKIKSPSQQQQGLKPTIKSTSSSSGGSGSGSGSSSSKHRSSSDYHHKSSSGSSSSKHSSSGSSSKHSSSSSSSSAKRSSPSISQMTGSSSSSSSSKHSKSPSSSSSLLKSSSSSSLSSTSSSKADRAQRDKDRIEEVKRLLGGNKLDTTTFQIPKRTKPESGSNSIISNSSSNPTGQPSLSKSANASPKYNTSPSPKYGVSPKPPSLSPSTGNSNSSTALLNTSAPSPPHLAAFDKTAGCDKDINIGINNSK